MVGAVRLYDGEFLVGRPRGDHGRPQNLAHLYGGEADPAAGPMHQQKFSRL